MRATVDVQFRGSGAMAAPRAARAAFDAPGFVLPAPPPAESRP